MPAPWRLALWVLACALTAPTLVACGEPDSVRIARATSTPAAKQLSPAATPARSIAPTASATRSATPSPAASLTPGPTPSPSPATSVTASPSPAGCTAEAVRGRVRPSVVQVVNQRGGGRVSVGSGFAVAPGGQIITNEHVVNGAVALAVILPDGRRMPAGVVRADEGRDLALISAPGAALPPLRFSGGATPAAGERLFALGFPQAEPSSEPALTSGSLVRVEVIGGATFLQTDVPAGVGNSGGPLLTPCGEVVGAVSSGAPQASGITFAVAGTEVEAFIAGVPPLGPGGTAPAATPTRGPTATPTPAASPRPTAPASPAVTPTRTATPIALPSPRP